LTHPLNKYNQQNLGANSPGNKGASVGNVGNKVDEGAEVVVIVCSSSLLNNDLNIPGILN
jgi:hypothetical protein